MNTQEQALNRLKKVILSDTLAEHLVSKGITSVMQLAMLPAPKLKELLHGADPGQDTVKSIQKRARTLKAIVDNHLLTVRGQVSPYYKALPSTNGDNVIIDFHEGMESYDEMFGSLAYADCPEFGSVLSPAAYLVDLMRYIDEYITVPEDSPLQLKARRPDIWEILLNIENTVTEIPYLEVVNDILRAKIKKDRSLENALLAMAESVYLFTLPYNMPLEQIRAYLEALKTELYDIYTTFNIGITVQNREYVKLSPEQSNYVSTPRVNKDDLNLAYGYIATTNPAPHFTGIVNDEDLGGLTDADILMNQFGFTETGQLKALLYQNIDMTLSGAEVLLKQLFINKKSGTTGPVTIKTEQGSNSKASVQPLTMPILDLLNRFIRLAGMLQWSYEDLDWVLVSLGVDEITQAEIEQISVIKQLTDRMKITVQQATSFWHDIKTYGQGETPVSRSLFDELFNEPMLFDQALNKPYQPKYDLNPNYKDTVISWDPDDQAPEANRQIGIRLMAALNLDAANLKSLVNYLKSNGLTMSVTQEIPLSVPNLSVLYRYALLVNSLQLSVNELVVLLELIGIKDTITFSGDDILNISNWNTLLKDNQITSFQLAYISQGVKSKEVDPGFDLKGVPGLLKTLSEAAVQWYLSPEQLQPDDLMTAPLCQDFYNTLSKNKDIDDRGIILKDYFDFTAVSDLIRCETLKYTRQKLISVFTAGKTPAAEAASLLEIPANQSLTTSLSEGTVSVWFKSNESTSKTKKEQRCTLLSIYDTTGKTDVLKMQISNNELTAILPDKSTKIATLPTPEQWHLLIISFKEKSITIDTDLSVEVPELVIPPDADCALNSGNTSDSSTVQLAELKVSDKNNTIVNSWLLNEGQGVVKAADLKGNADGNYTGDLHWTICYNIKIPPGFQYLESGSLSPAYDPRSTENGAPLFVALWKTIVKLRNILNTYIDTQKKGTLQKLADYYQFNNNLAVYADYISLEDNHTHYVQTLLTYRFSLSWPEYALDLSDRTTPFISSNLQNQFHSHKIVLPENAKIVRLKNDNDDWADQWLITTPDPETLFLLNKRKDNLDIYKLLPRETAIKPVSSNFSNYQIQQNVINKLPENQPHMCYMPATATYVMLVKQGDYIRLAVYDAVRSGQNNVITEINAFITDLGQLLYTVKALKLSNDEFSSLLDNFERFFGEYASVNRYINFSLPQLKSILLFKDLNAAYQNEDMSFTDYFYLPDDRDSLLNYIPELTGWDANGVEQLSEWNCDFNEFNRIPTPKNNIGFGSVVGISHHYAAASAPTPQQLYIYELDGEIWNDEPLKILTPPDTDTGSDFGTAVAMQYDPEQEVLRIATGAPKASPKGCARCGAVYIYEYDKKEKDETKRWKTTVTLTASDAASDHLFGTSVSMSGNTIAIGAPKAGKLTLGKAYIFERNTETGAWEEQAFDPQYSDTLLVSAFGSIVSLYGNSIAIGAAEWVFIFNVNDGKPVIKPQALDPHSIVNNGHIIAFSGTFSGKPVIQYIINVDTLSPSEPIPLSNNDFKGLCSLALEDNTLIVCDAGNTCYVYYIKDNILILKQHFSLSFSGKSSDRPAPIAINSDNLIASGYNSGNLLIIFYGVKHDVAWFGFVQKCFDLASRLGVSIAFLLDFIKLASLSLSVPLTKDNKTANEAAYTSYMNYAHKLKSALKTGRTDEAWNALYDPLQSTFLEKERDALTGYMLWYLRADFTDINTLDDLYELLLIDVASSGCRSISKIKAALNSLQLYIERCRMHLEPEVTLEGSADDGGDTLNAADIEWSWMSHYRIWEANREVFLFPENYYDPTLRKDSSNAYKDFQNKLSQSGLTNASAEESFQVYFDDLETLTNLKIVSNCPARISSFVNGNIIVKNTFFIFGKIKNNDGGYYYRTADAVLFTDPPYVWRNWTNWQKINTSIKADGLAGIYANDRPYIFWVEFTKQQLTGSDSKYSQDKLYNYVTKIYYAFQNANGKWTAPHLVPNTSRALDFTVIPAVGTGFSVSLPDAPEIVVLSSFMDIANVSVLFNVTGGSVISDGKPLPPVPSTTNTYQVNMAIDNILNLYERYLWPLRTDGAPDIRGNQNLGSARSATYVAGDYVFKNRHVLSFGADYFLGLAMPMAFNTFFNGSFTFGVWIKIAPGYDFSKDWPIISAKPIISPSPHYQKDKTLHLVIRNQKPYFGFYDNDTAGKTVIDDNEWVFLVFRYDAKNESQSIFVNGVLDTEGYNKPALQGNTQILVGVYFDSYARGQMADMFVSNEAFSNAKILSIYELYIKNEISDGMEFYEWELSVPGGADTRGNQNLGNGLKEVPGVLYVPGDGIFSGRNVLSLNKDYKGGLIMPPKFNTFFNGGFTLGIWIKMPSGYNFKTDWPILGAEGLILDKTLLFIIREQKPHFGFYWDDVQGDKAIPDNEWVFLVFRYDAKNGSQSIFINGEKTEVAKLGVYQPLQGSTSLRLGFLNNTYARTGQMADMFVSNEVFSDANILSIYQYKLMGMDTGSGIRTAIPGTMENYEWLFNANFKDVQGKNRLLVRQTGYDFVNGSGIFTSRQVLNINGADKKCLNFPQTFNTFFNGNFTVGVWVNAVFPAGNDWPIMAMSNYKTDMCLHLIVRDRKPYLGFYNNDLDGTTVLKDNEWVFLVYRYDAANKTQSIFVNGDPDASRPGAQPLKASTILSLGIYSESCANGNMADLFITNTVISDADIKKIYTDYVNGKSVSLTTANYYIWPLENNFMNRMENQNLLAVGTALMPTKPPSGRQVLRLGGTYKSYLSLPETFNSFFNASFSIGFWVSGTFLLRPVCPILGSEDTTADETLYVTIDNKGVPCIGFGGETAAKNIKLANYTWYFLVFTYDSVSKERLIYVNGSVKGRTSDVTPYSGKSQLNIGKYDNNFASADLKDLFVADIALSATEIDAIYHENVGLSSVNEASNTAFLNNIQNTNAIRVQQFNQDLFTGGAYFLYNKNSVNIGVEDLSSQNAYGKYYWELFYHIPMLVAQLLNTNRQFKDAKSWYEYIFNPTSGDTTADRFWQLGYFRNLGMPESIIEILTGNTQQDKNQILMYDLDPFDPEAIAYLRPGAFEKKTVMRYIKNLLDWGDHLFSQYTWENLTEAEMLYMLAKELLGKPPRILGTYTEKKPIDFGDIEARYPEDIPQFIIDIENMHLPVHQKVQLTPPLSASVSNFYFYLPENPDLPANYTLVATRLYEIRHCLNIQGQEQSLALFQPPVNPMALVAALGGGESLSDVPIGMAVDIPYYRFSAILQYANSITQKVIDFGREILSALEKNDAEALAMLRAIQEKAVLDLTASIKEQEIQELTKQGEVLNQSLESANTRLSYYNDLLSLPISVLEALALALNLEAVGVEAGVAILQTTAAVAHLIPTVYGFADGDLRPGSALDSSASALNSVSSVLNNTAGMVATSASYVRRAEEWELQQQLAQSDVTSIGIQKKINAIRLQNSQTALEAHHQTITNNENLQQFYKDKFTNRELYQWMIDQISSVYYQAYQMAYDLAKKAETAYQFELNTTTSFISYGYWDNSKKGLLAGEKLSYDLQRLEKAYIDNNERYLEIQKVVSLKELDPVALSRLIKTGKCTFELSEKLYDHDFPGHYNRKIKSVSITIPAVVGPYQTVSASLTQQSNSIVMEPDINTVGYLVGKASSGSQPPEYSLRKNWRPNQQIAVSRASRDAGLFELNFNDSRYLPFEGTGAVSTWELSIPQANNRFDLKTISDIVLYINYTAQDGGRGFTQQVSNLPEIKTQQGTLMISVKQRFNDAWNAFLSSNPPDSGKFSMKNMPFPPNLSPGSEKIDAENNEITLLLKTTDAGYKPSGLKLNGNPWSPTSHKVSAGSDSLSSDWELTAESIKASELLDIILTIPYKGTILTR